MYLAVWRSQCCKEYLAVVWAIQYIYMYVYKCVCMCVYVHIRMHVRTCIVPTREFVCRHIRVDTYMEILLCLSLYLSLLEHAVRSSIYVGSI